LSIFPTNFGWCGIAGCKGRITDILIGHSDADSVRRALARRLSTDRSKNLFDEQDWHPELRRRLEAYGLGRPVEFDDIDVDPPAGTPFRKRVLAITRRIAYGRTLSYGQLAERAGAPRAARAVGTVMSTNRLPILIPCHRVIAAAGKLGGYSAPHGLDLKARLLAMEAEAIIRSPKK
jgi:methylated-DNA-[protein]-cysteine S-methyltransferase